MSKIQRQSTVITLDIPFQKQKFWLWSAASVVLTIAGLLLLEVPRIGMTGIGLLLVIYLIPSLLAFDVMDSYNEDHQIPKLKHPMRFQIFIVNMLLGWTLAGWFLSLFLALKPGRVTVERVSYLTTVE